MKNKKLEGQLVLFRNVNGEDHLGYVMERMQDDPGIYWVEWSDTYTEYYYTEQIDMMMENVRIYMNENET